MRHNGKAVDGFGLTHISAYRRAVRKDGPSQFYMVVVTRVQVFVHNTFCAL